ncbi:hypothetical protein ACNR9Q_15065 [Maribacter sp. X9]|uniref:hypothetical protein n=1 Tax=Maribacter sp. X9 TaxID=3402159 RepID=UPI003AF39F07
MYLKVVMDLFHRQVVGWSTFKNLGTAETIIPAWKMAVRSNNKTDGIFSIPLGVHHMPVMSSPISLSDRMNLQQKSGHFVKRYAAIF